MSALADQELNAINPLPDGSLEAGGFGALLSGLLGKAGTQYVDSLFPSGNQPVAAVQNKAVSDAQAATLKPIDYKPFIIGGGIVLGVVVIAVVLTR